MMGSIRKVAKGARRHAAPPEFSTNISMSVIPQGTFIAPSGDWQYTFLCHGCLARTDMQSVTTSASQNLAWAISREALSDPGNRAGRLNHHHAGSGSFTVDLLSARHEKYSKWAKMISV
jgi:hypothetical protein